MSHALKLNEGERQMVLMALAHLAIERPGWDDALHRLALQIDNEEGGRPAMYDQFRALARVHVAPALRPDEGECKLCNRPAAPDSEFCKRHAGGEPVAEDYTP